MTDDLALTISRDARTAIVAGSGDPSAFTCHQVTEAISALVEGGVIDVKLDFAAIEFMDSSGIQCLITARRSAEDAGAVLTVVAMSEKVERILDVVGLLESFTGRAPD